MNRREKVALARKLQTQDELKEKGKGIFDSFQWIRRKQSRAQKELARRK